MKKGDAPVAMKGKQLALIHLEDRLKRVKLLAEQAHLAEEGRRRLKSAHHATTTEGRKVKVDSRPPPPTRPSRPATEAGKKKEDRRDRSTSAKPSTQPSTSKEPVRSEVKKEERKTVERRSASKNREMNRDKKDTSPYAKRNASSPASSSDSIQRLVDEVQRLKNENQKLRSKVDVDLTNSQDLKEWPRKDLLKLIAQLESKEVRKPVQAAVKKLQEMGDTMSLHDQLKLARETVEALKQQNVSLQEQLAEAQSSPTPPPLPPIRQRPDVPRLDMDWLHNSTESWAEKNGSGNGEDINEETNGQNGHTTVVEVNEPEMEVITDPALMPRWEYDQIACDIVHTTRAVILRKRFMERWKKDRADAEERIQPRK